MSRLDPALVLLAAGSSKRTTQRGERPKALRLVGDKAWVVRQLETFAEAGGRQAVVVLGHHGDAVQTAVGNAHLPSLHVWSTINPAPERGPFSSLQVGLQKLRQESADTDAFVLPVDVPGPGAPVWRALAGADGAAVKPVIEDGGGHPVLLRQALIERLLGLDPAAPEARLDVQLRQAQAVRVPVRDPRIRMNLNTPEDWERFLRQYEPAGKSS